MSAPPCTPPSTFAALADTSLLLAGTRSRVEKRRLLVSLLATLSPSEVAPAVGWLVEEPVSGRLGVGPSLIDQMSRAPAAEVSTVTLTEVEEELAAAKVADHGDRSLRVRALWARMTAPERALFAGSLTGSLRQGSLSGVMLTALAERAGRAEGEVRRVVMLHGSITAGANALLGEGAGEASGQSIELFRPLAPMLAASADSIDEALSRVARARIEWKVDGVRAQVHKLGSRVAVFSRNGNDITDACRPLLAALSRVRADAAVLDGELAVVGPDGAPLPFQDSFSSLSAKGDLAIGDRLRIHLFDCLHRDGADLLDASLAARLDALYAAAPDLVVPSAPVMSAVDAARFYGDALAAGQEGVVVKDLAAPYRLGARGRAWQKVKAVTTVDLIVLAAEWGSGRRKGYLSNLHLGARRADGSFCMVGKTFKGLTDEMLAWQTQRLSDLAIELSDRLVVVRPELVVEVRFNDVQRSSRYPGRVALRFARVVRYRSDKTPADVEPLVALTARAPIAPGAPRRRRGARDAAESSTRQLALFGERKTQDGEPR